MENIEGGDCHLSPVTIVNLWQKSLSPHPICSQLFVPVLNAVVEEGAIPQWVSKLFCDWFKSINFGHDLISKMLCDSLLLVT